MSFPDAFPSLVWSHAGAERTHATGRYRVIFPNGPEPEQRPESELQQRLARLEIMGKIRRKLDRRVHPQHDHIEKAEILRRLAGTLTPTEREALKLYDQADMSSYPGFTMQERNDCRRFLLANRRKGLPANSAPTLWDYAPFGLQQRAPQTQVVGTRVPTDSDVASIVVHVHNSGSSLAPMDSYRWLEGSVSNDLGSRASAGVLVVTPSIDFAEGGPLENLFMALGREVPQKSIALGGSPEIATGLADLLDRRINPERTKHGLPPARYRDSLTQTIGDPRMTPVGLSGPGRIGRGSLPIAPAAIRRSQASYGRSTPRWN